MDADCRSQLPCHSRAGRGPSGTVAPDHSTSRSRQRAERLAGRLLPGRLDQLRAGSLSRGPTSS